MNSLSLRSAPRFVALLLGLFTEPVIADEVLVMPYTCSMASGRPVLEPSGQFGHRVIGPREEHQFTSCSPVDPARCRTWTVHRFNMDCGGVRVPWVAVAANSIPGAGTRAWHADGRLHIRMPRTWNMAPDDPCARGPDYGPRWNYGQLGRYCADRRALSPQPVVDIPPGFAPMFNFDGIFVVENAPPVKAPPAKKIAGASANKIPLAAPVTTRVEPDTKLAKENEATVAPIVASTPTGRETVTPSAPPAVIAEGTIQSGKEADGLPTAVTGNAQVTAPAQVPLIPLRTETVTEAVDLNPTNANEGMGKVLSMVLLVKKLEILLVMLAGLLMAGLLVMRRRRAAKTATIPPRDFASVPLHSRRFELVVPPQAPLVPAQPPPQLSDAAHPPIWSSLVPRTREEALQTLGMGVAADASAMAIKKIVDGLRLSWHPDQAVDQEDRVTREARIRQINAAWDIIVGKRAESSA